MPLKIVRIEDVSYLYISAPLGTTKDRCSNTVKYTPLLDHFESISEYEGETENDKEVLKKYGPEDVWNCTNLEESCWIFRELKIEFESI